MSASQSPDFSPLAGRYARSRPAYPPALYEHLAGLLERRELAWDAATGNGQAARGLAAHFDRVIATDVSAEQIRHATPHPRIDYRVARSESSGLEDGSVDLVAVAAAAHWFDPRAFGAEVRRVTRPGGILAAWTYHVGILEPPFDRIFGKLYWEIVAPYFAEGARLVDARYETLELPGEPLEPPKLTVASSWSFDQAVDFVHSWSGTASYVAARGEDPFDVIAEDLRKIWGAPENVHELRWPLFARISRL